MRRETTKTDTVGSGSPRLRQGGSRECLINSDNYNTLRAMDIQSSTLRTGLVLPGGGARGAFQVGVLRAIADLLPHGSTNPFAVISGTSAGAINSVVLASRARRFRVAVAELNRVWGHFESSHVFRTDNWTMLKSSLHWLTAIVLGGSLVGMPPSLLDNAPLRALLARNI